MNQRILLLLLLLLYRYLLLLDINSFVNVTIKTIFTWKHISHRTLRSLSSINTTITKSSSISDPYHPSSWIYQLDEPNLQLPLSLSPSLTLLILSPIHSRAPAHTHTHSLKNFALVPPNHMQGVVLSGCPIPDPVIQDLRRLDLPTGIVTHIKGDSL